MATKAKSGAPVRRPSTAGKPAKRQRPHGWVWGLLTVLVVLGALFAVFRTNNAGVTANGGGPGYQVGSPAIGQQAPDFTLPASTGQSLNLASMHGKTVLLYFQEGVGCEPCWTQMKDLEADPSAVHAAGIDEVVSITTQPANLLAQKAHDEQIATPVLADTNLAVSKGYQANQYGMMGSSMDGHSFVLVGPDGKIQWRADYGGAPKYTMYVPVKQLLAQLMAGRRA